MVGNEKTFTLISAIVIVAIVFFAFLIYPKVIDKGHLIEGEILTVSAMHQYKNSTHVYVGSIMTPTPCFTVSAEAVVRESYPEQVTMIINTKPTSEEICAQVLTEKKFKIAFQASKEAVISATLNSTPVDIKATEAPEGVDLEGMPID